MSVLVGVIWDVLTAAGSTLALTLIVAIAVGINCLTLLFAGSAAIVAGLLLLVLAGGSFRQADTDMIPFRDVSTLVTDGVYRFTRNPMYLGMALILLGTACTTGVASGLAVPVAFMAPLSESILVSESRTSRADRLYRLSAARTALRWLQTRDEERL